MRYESEPWAQALGARPIDLTSLRGLARTAQIDLPGQRTGGQLEPTTSAFHSIDFKGPSKLWSERRHAQRAFLQKAGKRVSQGLRSCDEKPAIPAYLRVFPPFWSLVVSRKCIQPMALRCVPLLARRTDKKHLAQFCRSGYA